MKTIFVLLFILCAAAAFGQSAPVLPSQTQPLVMQDHPLHAEHHDLACERPLVGGTPDTYTYAQGERPLWEFGPVSREIPLGDVARAYRQGKVAVKKAEIVLEKQGS